MENVEYPHEHDWTIARIEYPVRTSGSIDVVNPDGTARTLQTEGHNYEKASVVAVCVGCKRFTAFEATRFDTEEAA